MVDWEDFNYILLTPNGENAAQRLKELKVNNQMHPLNNKQINIEEVQKPKNQKQRIPKRKAQKPSQFRNYPDFIDTLIIILVSVASIIFIFWIASQTLTLNSFVKLPDFIQNSFSAVWSSIATGATGIGLAFYKALTRKKDQHHPNYLLWIGITTVSFLLLILFILFVLKMVTPVKNQSLSDSNILISNTISVISNSNQAANTSTNSQPSNGSQNTNVVLGNLPQEANQNIEVNKNSILNKTINTNNIPGSNKLNSKETNQANISSNENKKQRLTNRKRSTNRNTNTTFLPCDEVGDCPK